MHNDVVIEIRGGCLVGVYSANRRQDVILVDWDNMDYSSGASEEGRVFPATSLDEMPNDTRLIYEQSISGERRVTE